MLLTDYLAAINAPGVGSFGVEWTSEVRPAAKWKCHTLTKVTTAICLTGVAYADLAVNSDRETGPLPWGEWAEGLYPYVITHRGQSYARLYTVDGTVRTRYYVDGVDVSRDEFLAYLTPSQRGAARPHGGVCTVKMSGVRLVGTPVLSAR